METCFPAHNTHSLIRETCSHGLSLYTPGLWNQRGCGIDFEQSYQLWIKLFEHWMSKNFFATFYCFLSIGFLQKLYQDTSYLTLASLMISFQNLNLHLHFIFSSFSSKCRWRWEVWFGNGWVGRYIWNMGFVFCIPKWGTWWSGRRKRWFYISYGVMRFNK
jgi:hypothetical protein